MLAEAEQAFARPRAEVAGEVQLGIEVEGADHRHRPQSAARSSWATSSTSAAVEGRDREHGPLGA